MGKQDKILEFEDCHYEHETDHAWLLDIEGEKVWVPKSQCEYDESTGILEIPEWLALAKELI